MKKFVMIFTMALAMIFVCNTLSAMGIDPIKTATDGNIAGPEQINDREPEPPVFWYFIRIRLDGKKREIEITGGGGKISSGTKKAFSKAVWWGIAHRQMAIGPFYSEAEALNSKIYYKKNRDKINELPQATAPSTMHWFEVQLTELKRLNSFEFTHSPAAVSSGSAETFTDALYEGLTFQRLSIGPFWDYTQAEEAKTIYRLNE
ncbi:MAG: hypothetical protein J6T96_08870 [Bacteroidales bacterium]|nr:hypothetical protein [Bacteroidales bacterium]MBO7462695.1 hypothetical protein [Bacteroidales bacterium]MBO7566930.1 hypothetical protein [Bacteroidales bacterium]